MRRIISKHKIDKKKRRNQFIVSGILVFIMFFSVLGYSFGGRENGNIKKINYNGFEFVNQNDFWVLNIKGFNFIFRHNPQEVEKIYSNLNSLDNYLGEPLYIYSENNEAELEIYKNFDPRFNSIVQRIQPACFLAEECEENWPIKTCEDNFIIIKESNITKIIQDKNCVFIESQKENLTRITDEFLFKILGIEQ